MVTYFKIIGTDLNYKLTFTHNYKIYLNLSMSIQCCMPVFKDYTPSQRNVPYTFPFVTSPILFHCPHLIWGPLILVPFLMVISPLGSYCFLPSYSPLVPPLAPTLLTPPLDFPWSLFSCLSLKGVKTIDGGYVFLLYCFRSL